ncbi:MAG: tetratricopeptide repeat protein [Vicinamibacterales bacterium]|jgi:tetratricopeptide (TPR) repeat protein|nr:tetratricopeptide repeat protein [Vicinamibacterales bacterium]
MDPLSRFANTVVGIVLLGASRNDDAIGVLEKALEIEGDFVLTLNVLGAAYSRCSRHDEATALTERTTLLAGRGAFGLGWLGTVYAAAGQPAEAEKLFQELLAKAERDYVPPPYMVWPLGALGRLDEAFSYVDQAYEDRHPFLVFHMIPNFDSIRRDSRYLELLRRMKLAPAA